MKKTIITLLLLITFTGCSSDELTSNYEQMQISDELTGYSLRVKVSGISNNSFTIRNYMNEEYEVKTENSDVSYNYLTGGYDGELTNSYYVVDDVIYEVVEDEYIESEVESLHTDTNIYLESLITNKGIEQLEDKELGTNTYKVYEINPKKSFIKDLLEYLDINPEYENAVVTVLIDSEGYVYSVEYNIDNTNIYVFYSKFNSIRELDNFDNE